MKPSSTYEGLFLKWENPWSDLTSFLHQGIRNEPRPPVSLSNRQCSDSCCLIMVCEDSGTNPRRHPVCLVLLPSRGAAIHSCQVGRSFSRGDQCKMTSLSPNSHRGRSCGGVLKMEVQSGSWGAEGLHRCIAKHDALFIHRGETGSHTVHLALTEWAD